MVKFEVFGQEYPLYTDAPEEDVQEILRLVKSQLENHSQSSTRLPSNKVAILTCLNMAGEYVKLKRELERFQHDSAENIESLTKKIESFL